MALLLVYLLALSGAGLSVAGVFMIFGIGWACIAAGAFLIAAASILARGLTPDA